MSSSATNIQPDVSIVIVNYNVRDFLKDCLESIRAAVGGLAVETIVVDNDSADGSVEFLTPLFPEVQFVALDENLGFGKANNLGFDMAKGRYVLCLNPDTLLSEDTLTTLVSYMDANTNVGLAGCKLLNEDGTLQLACRRGFPRPWVAFTRIFGLQSLFPKARAFAQYNQTFLPEDETNPVDAVSGAFMFMRKDVLEEVQGFDPAFFMYGEDLDLCYRITQAGYKVMYVPGTTVIHFKGESTRRSSLNRIKVFYSAMEIFAAKHFGKSRLFLLFIRLGIVARALIAYAATYAKQMFLVLGDSFLGVAALSFATLYRTGYFRGFPEWVYPWILIVMGLLVPISLWFAGEYSPSRRPSLRNVLIGWLGLFFVLSTFTYFVPEFAFSRVVLTMTVAGGIVGSSLLRIALSVVSKTHGVDADKRIVFLGNNRMSESISQQLEKVEARNATVVGVIAINSLEVAEQRMTVVGRVESLSNIIAEHHIDEVIVTDKTLSRVQLMQFIAQAAGSNTKFSFADQYDDVVVERILQGVTGERRPEFNLSQLRYRAQKRVVDISTSVLLLTIGLPVVYLASSTATVSVSKLWSVLRGKRSLFGLYPTDDTVAPLGKIGLLGLAHINNPEQLSQQAIRNLNDYYARHYSLALDFEILVKYFLRKKRNT